MINDQNVLLLMSTIIVCASGTSAYLYITKDNLSNNPIINFFAYLWMMLMFVVLYGIFSVILGLLAINIFL